MQKRLAVKPHLSLEEIEQQQLREELQAPPADQGLWTGRKWRRGSRTKRVVACIPSEDGNTSDARVEPCVYRAHAMPKLIRLTKTLLKNSLRLSSRYSKPRLRQRSNCGPLMSIALDSNLFFVGCGCSMGNGQPWWCSIAISSSMSMPLSNEPLTAIFMISMNSKTSKPNAVSSYKALTTSSVLIPSFDFRPHPREKLQSLSGIGISHYCSIPQW